MVLIFCLIKVDASKNTQARARAFFDSRLLSDAVYSIPLYLGWISLFVCMLDYSDPARTKALRNSVLFLGHRFPNVRKTTAEALYLKLLANEDIVDEVLQ